MFYNWFNLNEIIIPTTIERIEDCFQSMHLKIVKIPNSVTYINHFTLYNLALLERLEISKEWELEGNQMFRNNKGKLISIKLPRF